MVLVRLHQPVICTGPLAVPVVSVQHQLCALHIIHAGNLTEIKEHISGLGVDSSRALGSYYPDQLLHRMVEGQPNLLSAGRQASRDRFVTRELYLFHQKFVAATGKLTAFVRIQINIVDIQRAVDKRKWRTVGSRGHYIDIGPDQGRCRSQFHIELYFVVLYDNVIFLAF